MENGKHTPLPDVIVEAFGNDTPSIFRFYDRGGMHVCTSPDERKAMAAEIQKRVNTYEKLVEALRHAIGSMQLATNCKFGCLPECISALKLAEEGK